MAALAPALIAVIQLGRLHPDEVYQALEPAFHRAHGYGVLAWEWRVGLRNWAVPGFFGWLLSACKALGIDQPRAYRAVLEVPQYLLHTASLYAAYRYIERRSTESPTAGFLAVAFYGVVLAYAGRTMSESFSTMFALIAIDALDRTPETRKAGALGGAALGMAVVTRYGSAVLVLGALAWLVFRRRWLTLYYAVFGGLVIAAALGALDWATWGRPFHSFREYVDFNVLSGRAAQQFGGAAWWFYLPILAWQVPLWSYIALPFAIMRPGARLSLPLFAAVAYVAVLSGVSHKEERFLYPALVLLALAAAPGLVRLLELLHRPKVRFAATAAALAIGLIPVSFLGERRDLRGDEFRAIVKATRPPATGLLIVNEGVWGAGGYFYIGRNIPWTVADWAGDGSFQGAMRSPQFNRVVTYDDRELEALKANGFEVADRIDRATILKR